MRSRKDAMGLQYMTRDGHDKLVERLNFLTTEKRRECARDLAHAREFGDLSENAEYDAAKEKQAHNEREIRELSEKLASARVLDDRDIPKDKAYLGAIVKIRDLEDDEVVEFTLVSSLEADIPKRKLSVASPLGKALLGHTAGTTVETVAPDGRTLRHEILSIRR